jgi:hypothetical protein
METPYEKIRAISTTFKGDRFAVAEFSSNIQVWDLQKGLINKFITDFDAGNKRFSISQDGQYLAVGGYSANTISVYHIDSGQKLWQRKDLKKCGNVTILNKFNNHLFVNLERQGTYILDINTGETIEKLQGVEHYYENALSGIDLLEKSTTISLVDRRNGKTFKSLPKTSFAILGACFTINEVAVTYSANPFELIDLISYKTKWKTNVVGHFLCVSYSEAQKMFHGVRWDFNVGGSKFLSYIDPENGTMINEIHLGEPIEMEFLSEGRFLLTSKGQLIDTSSGKLTNEFNFEVN